MNAKMQQWGLISSWQRQRVPTPAVPRRAVRLGQAKQLCNYVKYANPLCKVSLLLTYIAIGKTDYELFYEQKMVCYFAATLQLRNALSF